MPNTLIKLLVQLIITVLCYAVLYGVVAIILGVISDNMVTPAAQWFYYSGFYAYFGAIFGIVAYIFGILPISLFRQSSHKSIAKPTAVLIGFVLTLPISYVLINGFGENKSYESVMHIVATHGIIGAIAFFLSFYALSKMGKL